ncbi:MAG TPA: response regulator, partial [Bacteroidetes bacterium]|nr:response regulator [Bacteroidota bacterium]
MPHLEILPLNIFAAKMIRTALIDDERDARQALRLLLDKHCPDVEVIGEATGITEAAPLIRQQKPELLFLDISMQDGTGFDLLDQFPDPAFRVIFTTAFDNFAIKAFRYNALDYLLKPIDPNELVMAIAKVKKKQTANFSPKGQEGLLRRVHLTKKINGLLDVARSREFKKIALSSRGGLVFLKLDEIVHLEADGN